MEKCPPLDKIFERLVIAEGKNVELEARVAKLEKKKKVRK
jgi:hypothetical protein